MALCGFAYLLFSVFLLHLSELNAKLEGYV
jgi:hypothetical protein